MATIEEALLHLYRREIGVSIASFPGIAWDVKVGDALNGYLAEADFKVEDIKRIGDWLVAHSKDQRITPGVAPPGLQPYIQKWPRLVSMEEWLAKAHPDAPALPWTSDDGREICSMAVAAIGGTGGIVVELYDAHGREVARSGDQRAIEATALALGVQSRELTFLPAAHRPRPRLKVVR